MEVSAWAKNRDKLYHYNRREPENSALYRLIYHYREEFEYRYDALFSESYGFLRKEVLAALDAYLDCGVLRHGCARAVCESCQHSVLIAFSCKTRGACPSCAAKRAYIFAENLHKNILLPYPHKHAVFTIPVRLRAYFKYERKLNRILYKSAWNARKEYILSRDLPGVPAAVLSLHTAGDYLNFHPHIHGLLLCGTLDAEGNYHAVENLDLVS